MNKGIAGISVFIGAHADDWQLFMQPHAFRALADPQEQVIFILTTAGDAGRDPAFWGAREEGHLSAIRFCLAAGAALFEGKGKKEIVGRHVPFAQINQTISYFLRLPDGGLDGNGFSAQGFQSLWKLKAGMLSQIQAVDGSVSYDSWKNLRHLIAAILSDAKKTAPKVTLHYLDPNPALNPADHPDHRATGELVSEITGCTHVRHGGYQTVRNNTLSPEELFWKTGMFAAYEKAVWDAAGYSTLKENPQQYIRWINRGA